MGLECEVVSVSEVSTTLGGLRAPREGTTFPKVGLSHGSVRQDRKIVAVGFILDKQKFQLI